MDYFKILNLKAEPFSNSPDPGFFYRSEQHQTCLQKLELAVRLKRGLNVIIGDVGTGKTTLSRQFILQHKDDGELEVHLILDPSFNSPMEFLSYISGLFGLGGSDSEWQHKENIKNYLFRKGVDEGKTVIIVIDEGQKLPEFCLEVLREFMNYETNEFKLLQIIIFAQNEFRATMEKRANFADRVNLCSYLMPLSFKETRALINFRIQQASSEAGAARNLFTLPAYWTIFRLSEGRPRKIIQLCHKLLLSMIIQNRSKVSSAMVKACFHSTELPKRNGRRWAAAALGIAVVVFALIFTLNLTWNKNTTTPVKIPEVSQKVPEVTVKPTEAGSKSLPVSPTASNPAQAPSGILGRITITRGDTVDLLVRSVYNSNTGRIFSAVAEVNPQIRNLNRINAGAEISFPLVPITSKEAVFNSYWVRYGEFDRLEKAYTSLRRLRGSRVPVKIASYGDGKGSVKFILLSSSGYASEEAAERAIALSGVPGSALISLDRNMIYYSDLN